MDCVDEIFALFEDHGKAAYFGEAVSQEEHALQAAHFAAVEGAPDPLVVAALVHDIGHLIDAREDAANRGIDARHEDAGYAWLARFFAPAVTEPVRLHVATQLGYKSAKWVSRIELVASLAGTFGGTGGYWEDQGYEWYAGI